MLSDANCKLCPIVSVAISCAFCEARYGTLQRKVNLTADNTDGGFGDH